MGIMDRIRQVSTFLFQLLLGYLSLILPVNCLAKVADEHVLKLVVLRSFYMIDSSPPSNLQRGIS
jgi:hypothetical protein